MMSALALKSEMVGRYLADFERAQPGLPGRSLPWLQQLRQEALERFASLGFPTARDEDWKYTSVAAIEKRTFRLALTEAPAVEARQVESFLFPKLACRLLVFVNGRFLPGLSRLGTLPAGVTVASLAEALEQDRGRLEEWLPRQEARNGFEALNAAFLADGAFVHLAPGAALEEPVHLLYLSTGGERVAHVRNLIVAEKGASATVIEHYGGIAGSSLTNALTQIVAGTGAFLEHVKLQREDSKSFHIAGIHAHQQRGSRFVSHSIAFGAQLCRNDISTLLGAEGCECLLNGLYMVGGRQHVDHHTLIDHAQPHGTSREYYRGVLDGASRGVFNGRVIVRPNAQQTDAQQVNNNLLLSRDAEVDAKPQLEIYADDVKCTHGATVGSLDPDMLFYLRSRGVGEGEARNLLTYAFANDILNRIKLEPVRLQLEEYLAGRLPAGEAIREYI